MNLTEDEWRQALVDAVGAEPVVDDPSAKTASEIADMLKCCQGAARKYVKQAIEDGKMSRVRVMRLKSDGRPTPVWAYKFTDEWLASR
ncbi:MAG: hypothetical protein KKC55_17245 [Gammaproteobacteria bacterium]|nr:hypothetical protein [Gammaproteobacteria bacterium]